MSSFFPLIWLLWVFINVWAGYSLVAACRLLVAAAFFCREAHALEHADSVVVLHELSFPASCGIFQTRDQTHVSCIGRRILNHWATREVLHEFFRLVLNCIIPDIGHYDIRALLSIDYILKFVIMVLKSYVTLFIYICMVFSKPKLKVLSALITSHLPYFLFLQVQRHMPVSLVSSTTIPSFCCKNSSVNWKEHNSEVRAACLGATTSHLATTG